MASITHTIDVGVAIRFFTNLYFYLKIVISKKSLFLLEDCDLSKWFNSTFSPRNPTDSVLERNDAEFVARIRDAVINELEVFKQSANAYLIWGDTEKTEGAFRRGMTRLRQSFRRQRTPSTSGRRERPNKLEGWFHFQHYYIITSLLHHCQLFYFQIPTSLSF